jgi:DNA-binding NarL/FixJ family response regulator
MTSGERPPMRVMIADDHTMVRVGLRALLDVPDIEVVGEATSGPEAVELAREVRPDIILMDVRMPGGDGLTATRAVREVTPETKVLVVTSFDDDDYLRSAVQAGASGFVLKQASRALLLESVRTVHAGGSTFPFEMMEGLLNPSSPSVPAESPTSPPDAVGQGEQRIGRIRIGQADHVITVDDREVVLTYLEFRALAALAEHPGAIVSYEALNAAVWPDEETDPYPHRLVSLVARLRTRLGPARHHIQTVKRVGYRLAAHGPESA